MLLLLHVAILLLVAVGAVGAGFITEKVTRTISLNNANAIKITAQYKITRSASASYLIHLPGAEQHAGNLARATCQLQEEANNNLPLATTAAGDVDVVAVTLPAGFSQGTLSCTFLRTRAVQPYPKEITQTERQRGRFQGDYTRALHAYSGAAPPLEQHTIITLPGRPDQPLPPALASECQVQPGNKLVCAGGGQSSVKLDVTFDTGQLVFARFGLVEREVEVSHWGSVQVEEHFDLHNFGAKLKGGFSRVDHSRGNFVQVVRSLVPKSAVGVYYRDALGNVTTSQLLREKHRQLVELKLRFPVYGGWHIEWYTLEVDAFHSVGLPADVLVMHLVLPAGASEVHVEVPPGAQTSQFRRYTYLDVPWSARTVVRVELHDVLGAGAEEALLGSHPSAGRKIKVHYTYEHGRRVVEKPLAVSAGLLAVMLTWMGLGRSARR